jgi:hypothetical protein
VMWTATAHVKCSTGLQENPIVKIFDRECQLWLHLNLWSECVKMSKENKTASWSFICVDCP